MGTRTSGYTGSVASLALVKAWISDCKQHHTRCQISPSRNFPTRVLKLDSSSPPSLRLYELKGEFREPYVCLSHCWGIKQPLKTVKSNLDRHFRGIPWSDLPRTFADACEYTLRLGYKYIWIDSLCIIQDDEADWQHEAARMASVYSGAVLTLAASKSQDSSGGLFATGTAETRSHPLIWTDSSSKKTYKIYAQGDFAHFHSWNRTIWLQTRFLKSFPLLERAWCFQERILSPRFLHFGTDELIWECMEKSTCECSPGSEKTQIFRQPKTHIDLQSQELRDLAHFWRWLVQEYTKLKLTYASDRLPAIAGLAESMSSTRQSRYLFGCWEDSILRDINWSHFTYGSRPNAWRAPTWSWASMDGGGDLSIVSASESEEDAHETHPSILSISCQPPQGAVSDAMTSCILTIRGLLITVDLLQNAERDGDRPLDTGERYCPPQKGRKYDFLIEVQCSKGEVWRHEFCPDTQLELPLTDEGIRREKVYCLKLSTLRQPGREPITSLVLRKVDHSEQLYERVGLSRWGQQYVSRFGEWYHRAEETVVELR